MNGLKVYLKSGTTKVYVYAQAVVGILLIGNALREYEHAQNHYGQLLATVGVGLLLMLGVVIRKRWRRQLRLVPGILIALGGLSLLWLTNVSSVHVYYAFNPLLTYISYGLIGLGLLQPLVDHRLFAYFHSQGIRYRVHAFRTDSITWDEVKGIVYFDQGFELALKNRKTYRMHPYNGESQNLRLYIDQMLQNGRQNAGKVSVASREEEQHSSISRTPVAGA
jgi:hypothetical protein